MRLQKRLAVAQEKKLRKDFEDQKNALNDMVRWGKKAFPNSAVAGLGKFGTAEIISIQHETGGLPSYNFNSVFF